jgi:transcription elongation factor Elf1
MGLDIKYIENKIYNILNKTHKEGAKRQIKRFPSESNPERLNFACPYCGDSQKSVYKKRGNLYMNNLMFKCFNCDMYVSFIKLCDNFKENIEIDERLNLYNYIDDKKFKIKTNEYALSVLDKLIDINKFVEVFNSKSNSWLYNIKPVEKYSNVYNYLNSRLIYNHDDIYQGIYRVIRDGKVKFKTDVLINLNKGEDKLLGIQLRNLEKKERRFYKIVEFDELYNFINDDNLDDMEAISYNKLSHFYNILNVDFEDIVTVFEGFLDSKFFPNSIGLVGAKNDNDLIKFLIESDENLKLRFFYDNDITGIKKSTALINKDISIFLWNKLFKKLIVKSKNKYDCKELLNDIIDLNDLVIKSNNPNIYDKLKLEKFFSMDKLDILYLDKLIFNKVEKTWSKKNSL